ncbi:MAG: hypothetical protein MJ249_00840 [Kiritimatiellae bacterium]|nr:hypothetical protein [Kiritimatiellia bacterium]
MSKILTVAILLLFVGIGCGQSNRQKADSAASVVPGQILTNATSEAYADLSANALLVAVGGSAYRKADLEAELVLMQALMRANSASAAEGEQQFKESVVSLRRVLFGDWVNRTTFFQEATARRIVPTQEDLAVSSRAITNLCQGLRTDLNGLAQIYPGGRGGLEARVRQEAVNRALFRVLFTNALEVTDAEVDELHARLVKLNGDSAVTNAARKAKLQQLRTQLIAQKVVFSDDEEKNAAKVPEGFTVSVFESSPGTGFEDDEIVPERLRNTKVGDWTDVLELENTYDIYYVSNVVAKTAATPTLYTGVRVAVDRDHGYLVPEKNQLRVDIRRRRNEAVVVPVSDALQRKYGVFYGHGVKWMDNPRAAGPRPPLTGK